MSDEEALLGLYKYHTKENVLRALYEMALVYGHNVMDWNTLQSMDWYKEIKALSLSDLAIAKLLHADDNSSKCWLTDSAWKLIEEGV